MKSVHTEHCDYSGCKYGELDCPVYLGYQKPSYPQSEKPAEKVFRERIDNLDALYPDLD